MLVLLLILVLIVAVMIVSFVIKLIFRILFRPIRFLIVFAVIAVALFLLSGMLAKNPVTKDSGEFSDIVNLAADKFKGLYSSELPLLAWRVSEESPKGAQPSSPPQGVQGESQEDGEPVLVRVQYLPVGEIVMEYDTKTNEFNVVKGLDAGQSGELLFSLFEKLGASITDLLPSGLLS